MSELFDVARTLTGKRILFVGSTGFVGKVALAMLLDRYPEIGSVFVLVRPGAGSTSEERFFRKVVKSPVFDPLRRRHGDGFDAFLREKCVPLAGDAARPLMNFTEADFASFGHLDCIINCAGLVSFTPSLETAMRINTMGPRYAVDVARKTGAGLVHISTCFVAGNRSGEIWEDEPVDGYYPRKGELRDEDFDVDAEISDCERLIAQVKALADDRAHISMFRDRAAERLQKEGRDPDDAGTLKLAVARERKMWVSERLTALGMERAQHWGWPNIYTYSKSLGDQVVARARDIRGALVRPSIVETSMHFPFEGWNEGFTTSAPMTFLIMKGHRTFATSKKANLDVVPVDLVAASIIAASAAVIAGRHKLVYQCSTSDTSPLPSARAVELTALWARRHWRERETGSKVINLLRARLEAFSATKERYEATSAPALRRVTTKALEWLDDYAPTWGAPRVQSLVADARRKLENVNQLATQTSELFELFAPFIHDNEYVFRSDNVRALFASMTEADREKLTWNPETIEWRHFWMAVHMPALKKWIFPDLEDEFKPKAKAVYQYKNLLELFDATVKRHKSRTALRLLPEPGAEEPVQRWTYRDLGEAAARGAAVLRDHGVSPGDRVLLMSENRPEWAIATFAVLRAGGVLVPLDEKATLDEVINVLRRARARVAILGDRVRERLGELPNRLTAAELTATRLGYADLLEVEPRHAVGALDHAPKGDELASLLFTSGTTGNPKGVMLSHRNFTSLVAKLCTVFDLDQHDRLLSVLPLHHTFEFTAGLLMPLVRGAQITYLAETTSDALTEAFEHKDVTGMIGVPALWQALHRKVKKGFTDQGPWAEEIFDAVVGASRTLRDKTGLNLGKLMFWPIHRKLGGRVRLMVSGASALPKDVLEAFWGLGFDMYEGYGLTEAAPVLAVARPGSKVVSGSVGEALPGVEIRIDNPDASGVGEIIASGPNVMMGYFEDDEATGAVLENGWLRTGDLGKIDEDKRLFIVGRKKEMILAANGENVYPDELEELYGASPFVKELSIVGLPDDSGGAGELVAALIVPDYEGKNAAGDTVGRAEVRARVLEHVRETSAKLPQFKRVKVAHLWDLELPRTATRKVKRRLVVLELQKLQRTVKAAEAAAAAASAEGGGGAAGAAATAWVYDCVAGVCQKPRDAVSDQTALTALGFDSLMYTELGAALDAAGVDVPEAYDLASLETVGDLVKWVETRGRRQKRSITAPARGAGSSAVGERRARNSWGARPPEKQDSEAELLFIPKPLVELGWQVLTWGQKSVYTRVFDTKVTGAAYLPGSGPFLVAANHASHLDMGLVKHALGDWGPRLRALAAKDYFFEDRLKRTYFETFTNLVPMDRHGSLRESLRLASQVLSDGDVLLIFPEGTRSPDGVMIDFKASIGYLALANKVDVLPMYLQGTYDALPKGATLPKHRDIAAHMGPLLTYEQLKKATAGLGKGDQYREAARLVEVAVRKLGKLPPLPAAGAPGAGAGGDVGAGAGAGRGEHEAGADV